MYKKSFLLMILIISFIALVGCTIVRQEDQNDGNNNISQEDTEEPIPEVEEPETEAEEPETEEEPVTEVDKIKEQIDNMSLEEKIGQVLVVGLDGNVLDNNATEMINNFHIGGFILFKKNMEDTQQILNLINDLKETNTKNNIPLFFSVDEEGGIVSRMPNEFKKLPSSRIIGQHDNKELSFRIGSVIAKEIKSFGFNMNFAPVLDIDSNPNNPVIGERAFGANEKIVSESGIQTMKGIQSKGVISVVKHFPGHGDTSVDSHIGLPTVDKDLNSLLQFELVPFINAIENNVDSIMVAHIVFNNIDPENPATLSKPIITDLLREELNFEGLVITDDMTMGAIMENYDIGDAAVKSINAGSDIVLVCHGYENQIMVLNAIIDAVKTGIISEERIDESLYRIIELKNKYELKDEIIEDVDIDKINSDISSVLNET